MTMSPKVPDLERHLAAEGVEALGGPLKTMAAALSCDGRGRLGELAWVGVEPLDAPAVSTHHERRSPRSTTRIRSAVAPQRRSGSARPVPVSSVVGCGRHAWHAVSVTAASVGQLVAVVPQEQLLQRGRLAGQGAQAELGRGGARSPSEMVGVDVEAGPVAIDRAGRGSPAARPGPAGLGDGLGGRSTCGSDARSSCSVPLCTVRPARMMLTRSHSASTSARMWLDSRTVRPSALTSRMQSWKTASISGSRPEVGSSRISSSALRGERGDQADLLPVALRVGARLLRGIELEALEQLVSSAGSRSPRSRPSRSMTSPPLAWATG